MARPKGFEPLTPRFVVWCSIQLSYGRASVHVDRTVGWMLLHPQVDRYLATGIGKCKRAAASFDNDVRLGSTTGSGSSGPAWMPASVAGRGGARARRRRHGRAGLTRRGRR
jgi:hypothetical protein